MAAVWVFEKRQEENLPLSIGGELLRYCICLYSAVKLGGADHLQMLYIHCILREAPEDTNFHPDDKIRFILLCPFALLLIMSTATDKVFHFHLIVSDGLRSPSII